MPGPNVGAGLKMSLHSSDEPSAVKDHGFSVPPGAHGLIAIKITEV